MAAHRRQPLQDAALWIDRDLLKMLRLHDVIERSSLRRRGRSEVLADTDVPLLDFVWGGSELSDGQKTLLHILRRR
jgi:hypothetical protein